VARVLARTLEAAEGDDDVPRTDTAEHLPGGDPTAGDSLLAQLLVRSTPFIYRVFR